VGDHGVLVDANSASDVSVRNRLGDDDFGLSEFYLGHATGCN
jgi:hypothetical protein